MYSITGQPSRPSPSIGDLSARRSPGAGGPAFQSVQQLCACPPAGGRCSCQAPGQLARLGLAGSTRGVLVLGHRGSPSPWRPENTVAAVASALGQGADGVEIDVRLTADGTLVCSHGPVVLTPTGRQLNVAKSSLAELRRAPLPGGHRLATLSEVLVAARRHGRRRVVVEAKPVADPESAVRTAHALRGVLAGMTAGVDITISSFDADLLTLIRGACAGVAARTALVGESSTPVHALLRRALAESHEEVHPSVTALRRAPHAVRTAHRVGVSVACWTVNGRRDLRWMAELGVDAVITDNVGTARATLSTFATVAPIADLQRGAC